MIVLDYLPFLLTILKLRPIFLTAFLISVGAIYGLLFLKRKLKEKRLKNPLYAKTPIRSNAALDQLPKEMLQTIFQFVDARAISHCVKVSKYWNFVISERKLQDEIYDREIASLKTNYATLNQITGGMAGDIILEELEFPASYPKRWIVQDCRRWQIYSFKYIIGANQMHTHFAQDPRLASRIRVKATGQNAKFWRFEMENRDFGFRKLTIRKFPSRSSEWAYFPVDEDEFEVDKKYDIISDKPVFFSYGQNQPLIHVIRPLDGPSNRLYNRLPLRAQLLRALCWMYGAMLFCDVIWSVVLANFILSTRATTTPLVPPDRYPFCSRNSTSSTVVNVVLFLILYVLLKNISTVAHYMQFMSDVPNRKYKLGLWLTLTLGLFFGVVFYFPTYEWWIGAALSFYCFPHESTWFRALYRDARRRKFANLAVLTTLSPILFLCTASLLYFGINITSLLIHTCFVFFTFGYARMVYVVACRIMAPSIYATSRTMKKWINWSLPVKFWFSFMLILPLVLPYINCLDMFVFG